MATKRYVPSGEATEALRYGRSAAAIKLGERIALPVAGDRWRPCAGGTALERVDQQGRPTGWVYAPKALLRGDEAPQAPQGPVRLRLIEAEGEGDGDAA